MATFNADAPIDFVLIWVDGSDPEWLKEFNRYAPKSKMIDISEARYRSWDNLQYWFRGIEKFSPWVNKVHLVTWGHVPEWLNISHPKLHIVRHNDYMHADNLPVFNANPIEINLHKIKGLSEQFVFFNDDMFLLASLKPTRFFKDGMPRDIAAGNVVSIGGIEHILVNNLAVINRHFSKKQQIKKNILKWINPKYGLHTMKTVCLLPWRQFTGFFDPHQPQPFLKSTYEKVWSKEQDILECTSRSRFRNVTDVSQYLFRYWQLVTGTFIPIGVHDTKYIDLRNINDCIDASTIIGTQQYHLVCLNDKLNKGMDYNSAKEMINNAFAKILPKKSSYEI